MYDYDVYMIVVIIYFQGIIEIVYIKLCFFYM